MSDPRVDAGAAFEFARAALTEAGYSPEDAELQAEALLDASLRGVDTHGIPALLPEYVRLVAGYDPGAEPELVSDAVGTAVVDGRGVLGVRAARFAVEHATARAGEHGLAAAAVRNVGYLGAMAFTIRPVAEAGLIALAATNGSAYVVPVGGLDPLHGTNPIAAAIPCEPHPIAIDTRTNEMSMAAYWEALRDGTQLPPGSLVLPDGRETTDPADMEVAGLLPMGGGRGYALGLLVDVLTASLSGAPIGRDVARDSEDEGQLSAFFLVLDPARFDPSFGASIARLAEQVHDTRPAHPSEPVQLPGEREAAELRRRTREGIPVDPGMWARMTERLRELGISAEPPVIGVGPP
jgi:LDH2 family malate/lactate/ureidoglycolate dehydrogenase